MRIRICGSGNGRIKGFIQFIDWNTLWILQSHEFRMRNFDDNHTEQDFHPQLSIKAKGKEHVTPLS